MAKRNESAPTTATGHAASPSTDDMEPPDEPPKPKISLLKKIEQIWAKTGIDWNTYRAMFKMALAPTIAMALYQSTAYAEYYTTLGYLIIIMTMLSLPLMPRSRLIHIVFMNTLFACLGAAFGMFGLYCGVKARVNSVGNLGPGTGGAGTSGEASRGAETAPYNSSASAVAGIFLMVQVFIASYIRAAKPEHNLACVIWLIVADISMTYGPQFSTVSQAEAFIEHLLIACLTGFAIALGVGLCIFPTTSRGVFFKGFRSYIAAYQGAVEANLTYMRSLEETDMFSAQRTKTYGQQYQKSKEAQALKTKVSGLTALHAKISATLPHAKQEIALGKLGPDDLQECFRLLRTLMTPLLGLSSLSDMFERLAEEEEWDRSVDLAHTTLDQAQNEAEKMRIEVINDWHELLQQLREPFGMITKTIKDGLQHILITLQLTKPLKRHNDAEANGDIPQPGDPAYTAYFAKKFWEFNESKKTMLRGWCHVHEIELPPDFFEHTEHADFEGPKWMQGALGQPHKNLRRQLFLCLYIESLLLTLTKRVEKIMIHVDTLRDGKLRKTRLIVPGFKRMRKWFRSLFSSGKDTHHEDALNTDGNGSRVYLGDAYKKRKDPEHLPPQNIWQRVGDHVRGISHVLRSDAANFALRACCASMSIGIIGLLEYSQVFFTKQRLFWALIMVSISLLPSSGASLRNFVVRVLGTTVAMVLSIINWYIVDGKTAGVIVFFFVFAHCGGWIITKYPSLVVLGIICPVTIALVVGYELQVRKIGLAVATSNGQSYHPVYVLAPIRLATVSAGLFVAWIWSVFPYPVSEHNQVRRDLGQTLYLLANYYSVTHEKMRLRLRDELGDMNLKDSPGQRLEKARLKIYSKANLAIQGLRARNSLLKFDIPIGGKFPREKYSKLIEILQSMLNFMSLVALSSQSFGELKEDASGDSARWLHDFQRVVGKRNMTSEEVTTLLCLVSASVTRGHPLPPYLRVPEPLMLSEQLDAVDKDILSLRHIAESGYSSFAVVQIATKYIYNDLQRLVTGVKELVGELDFSYHIVSTTDPGREASDETLTYSKTKSSREQEKND